MKKKNKKKYKSTEEKVPKKKEKRFTRSQIKNRLKDWEETDWEKLGSDDVKGEQNVTRND